MELFKNKSEIENINDPKLFFVVAVKDELTNEFLQPTFGENLDALTRIFKTQINTLPIWKDNPTDFSFYQLGKFDQQTGRLIPDIQKLCSGHSVIERKEKE